METIKAKKLTAANCKILAQAKREFNVPIYKRLTEIRNNEGPAAAVAYLSQFVREDFRAELVKRYETLLALI